MLGRGRPTSGMNRTLQNSTRYGSSSSVLNSSTNVAAHRELTEDEKLLKGLLELVNHKWTLDEIGIKNDGKPWSLRSLDAISSENLVLLVKHMLKVLQPGKDFEVHGVSSSDIPFWCNQVYDIIHYVHHALISILPPDADFYHFSVLLLPQQNRAKTRALIVYVFRLVLAWDNHVGEYEKIMGEEAQHNARMETLFQDIDILHKKIEKEAEDREIGELEFPKLEEDLKEETNNLELLQTELVIAQEHAVKAKRMFTESGKNVELSIQRRDAISRECAKLQDLVVEDTDLLAGVINNCKEEIADEKKRFDEIRKVVSEHADGIEQMKKLTATVEGTLTIFSAVTGQLGALRSERERMESEDGMIQSHSNVVKTRETERDNLLKKHRAILSGQDAMRQREQAKIQQLEEDLENAEKLLPEVELKTRQTISNIQSIKERTRQCQEQFSDLENKTFPQVEALEKLESAREEELQKFMEDMNNLVGSQLFEYPIMN